MGKELVLATVRENPKLPHEIFDTLGTVDSLLLQQ